MREYLASKHTWGDRHAGVLWARPVAYFSAEFGLHESLPIYSGGLGILAGDHVKSASDLGIPLIGVGLYYDQGYFKQRLDRDGWQQEEYLDVDGRLLPIQPAMAGGDAGDGGDPDPDRHDYRPRLAAGGRPEHAAAARFQRRRQPARRPAADGAAVRRRPPRPDPAGAVAGRRRRARARSDGHLAGRRASERGPQRICGARARAPAHGHRRHRRRRGGAPDRRRRSSSPRTRRCRPATTASRRRSWANISGRCATRWASATTS